MKTLKQYNAATQSWDVVGPAGSTGVVDLTNASSDYALAVGETAVVTYASALSVPLHIATVEGLYDLTIAGDSSVTIGTLGDVLLSANNTDQTAGSIDVTFVTQTTGFTDSGVAISPTGYKDGASYTKFNLSYGLLVYHKSTISTYSNSKTLNGIDLEMRTASSMLGNTIFSRWNNTSTAWTSLGTITFPFAQSGKIIIKRIV